MTILHHESNGLAPRELQSILSSGVLRDPLNFRLNSQAQLYPQLNIAENEDAFLLTADLPGLESSDVSVVFEQGSLVISGERTFAGSESEAKLLNTEISYGSFRRAVKLPVSADPDGVSATMKNGVLSITINKMAAAKPKRITVQS